MGENPRILELIRPGVNRAVDQAIHDLDRVDFHRNRVRRGQPCPLCPTVGDGVRAAMERLSSGAMNGKIRERLAVLAEMAAAGDGDDE